MRDNQAKLILFETLRKAPLTEAEASLYPVRLRAAMIQDGIARKRVDGGLELVNAGAYAVQPAPQHTMPPAAVLSTQPPGVNKPTISARIEHEDLAFLESIESSLNMSRADVIRLIFERARTMGPRFLGSVTQLRKTVGT